MIFYVFSYPIPTHSRHNLIAFESTVAASPRIAPYPIIRIAAARSVICAAALFICFISFPFLSFNILSLFTMIIDSQRNRNTLCLKKEDIFKICVLILKKLLRTSQAVPPYYKAVFVFSMINGFASSCPHEVSYIPIR